MAGNIWVVAEHWRGEISEITYELLALGRELADAAGVRLEAVLLGHEVRGLAATLGRADDVLYCEHAALAAPIPEIHARALAGLAAQRQPKAILLALTNASLGVGTLLAAHLSTAGVNGCKDVRFVDGRIHAAATLYGGKIQVEAAPAAEPAVLGVLPGVRPIDAGRSTVEPPVEDIAVDVGELPPIRFKGYTDPAPGGVDLTTQEVLVGVGRGIQSQDNVELAETLAAALGGAVGGSRPVIDQGWLPLARQIGKSGVTVKPKLYIAAGISGAPEHVEGMRNAGLILAINSDPGAPIFGVAHYGIVADALDILPALADAVVARKGQ